MYIPELGTRIKQLRNQKNISQVNLAKLLGVSKSVVSSYENGIHLPPYDVLTKMARIFGVSTDYLLGVGSNRVVCVEGLTDTQIEALIMIIDELRSTNRAAGAAE